MSRQRTEALLQVRVEHVTLPSMSNNCPDAYFRYADAVAERIGHDIRLISARADRHKQYR